MEKFKYSAVLLRLLDSDEGLSVEPSLQVKPFASDRVISSIVNMKILIRAALKNVKFCKTYSH